MDRLPLRLIVGVALEGEVGANGMRTARARTRANGAAVLVNWAELLQRTSVSGCDNFYLHEKLRPHELRNDKEH
jgi:hypothetical protein